MSGSTVCPKCKAKDWEDCDGYSVSGCMRNAAVTGEAEPFVKPYDTATHPHHTAPFTSDFKAAFPPKMTLDMQIALTLALASATDAVTREWIIATLQRGNAG